VEPEETNIVPIDDFERELRDAMERRPAPPGLKRRIMARRVEQKVVEIRHPGGMVWLERIAASMIFAAVAGSAAFWHYQEQEIRGEEVRQQVFTALRITNHALQQMNAQLAEHDRNAQ
jgi:hypothetical protein